MFLKLLRKTFINDYEDTQNENVRAATGVLASTLGLIINLILVLIKGGLAIYLAIEANWTILPMALFADAMNNLSDLGTCVVVIISFQMAKKPADEEHPFGHQRAEYIAGLIVSFLILLIAFETIRDSINKIISGDIANYDWLTIILLGVSILLKGLQGYIYLSLGKTINSKTLKTNAFDSFSDIFATSVVLIGGILGICLNWNFLDPYLGLAISLLIAITGIKLMKENIDPILGGKQNPKEVEAIRQLVLNHPKALGIHDILIHSYGPTKRYLSLHLEVDENTSLIEAHNLADHLEKEIGDKFDAEVLIHVDPTAKKDQETQQIEKEINEILSSISKTIKLHDLRLIKSTRELKICFDLLLPFSLNKNKEEIVRRIRKELVKKHGKIRLIIHFDNPF